MNKITKQNIETELIRIIREILQDDTVEIDPDKSLMEDYGLDSLDLLDFAFNVEETFGVQIGADELRGRAEKKMAKGEMLDEDGNISPRALDEFKRNIPEIHPDAIAYGLRPENIPALLNLRVFVRIVFEKLSESAVEGVHP